MNRNSLNTRVLGSGSTNRTVRVLIKDTLYQLGSLKGTVERYVSIAQEHTHTSTLRVLREVSSRLSSTSEQLSSVVGSVLRAVIAMGQTLHTQSAHVRGVQEVFFKGEQNHILESVAKGTQETAQHGYVIQDHLQQTQAVSKVEVLCPAYVRQLHIQEAQVIGFDISWKEAPEERRCALGKPLRSVAVNSLSSGR